MSPIISQDTTHENTISLSPILTRLLENRGIIDHAEQDVFLNPDYDRDTHDPFLLPDMGKAVDRILDAIAKEEKMIVYSDYDTDGIPAGVLLHDFFKKIGYSNFDNYIPHRNNEGYGLHKEAITQFAKDGVAVLITADCGITNTEEVSYAKGLGIDVIVTDHHLPDVKLPPAYAIVNPKCEDNQYPFDMLCGAGVAFKLVQGIIQKGTQNGSITIKPGWEKWLLDMVGLATISDMVPLIGENRAFAYYGLKVLRMSRRPGLQQLLRKAGVKQQQLTEGDVGFVIGPRINAASRMDTPLKAFHSLAVSDVVLAGELAEELHRLNEKRKGIVASILKEAKQRIARNPSRTVIVLGNIEWSPGVLGLVAHHLVGEYDCPVFLWGECGGSSIKGSCRSDGRINIVELMRKARDIFSHFGGHENSGGFSVTRSKLHAMEDELARAYEEMEKKEINEEKNHIDGTLLLEDVGWDMLREIEKLAPFGVGNPQPTFLFENVHVSESRRFGKHDNHLMLTLSDSAGRRVRAIQFFTKDDAFAEADSVSFTAILERNVFRGNTELRLRIVEIR